MITVVEGAAHKTLLTQVTEQHQRRTRRRVLIIGGLWVAALACFLCSMVVGPIPLTPNQILRAIFDASSPADLQVVVLDLRMPPALMAVLVGGALSLAGLQMQTILDNPLAEPFTLGVSAAAACGAAVAITTGLVIPLLPDLSISAVACVFALGASAIIATAARSRRGGRETMILLGIALVFGFQAILALLQYTASNEALAQIVFWSLGSLVRADWTAIVVLGVALLLLVPLFWRQRAALTSLRLGEDRAAAMGVAVPRLRLGTLIGVSVLAALSVSFVGIIGFAGLVGPHMARILVGEDQRYLQPAAIATGALLMSAAHTLSQLLVPGVVIPVGIITAMVGVPVFVAIVLGRRRVGGVVR